MMKKKKRREAKKNVPSRYLAQTEGMHRTAVGAELKQQNKRTGKKKANCSVKEMIEELGNVKDFNPKDWKTAGNTRVAQQIPPITMRQVATSHVTLPLCI